MQSSDSCGAGHSCRKRTGGVGNTANRIHSRMPVLSLRHADGQAVKTRSRVQLYLLLRLIRVGDRCRSIALGYGLQLVPKEVNRHIGVCRIDKWPRGSESRSPANGPCPGTFPKSRLSSSHCPASGLKSSSIWVQSMPRYPQLQGSHGSWLQVAPYQQQMQRGA